MRRLLGLLVILFVFVPSAATAHSNWVETHPDHGDVLETLPAEATVTFGEAPKTADVVLAVPGGEVRKLNAKIEGSVVHVGLPADGPRGDYELSYRVVSADGHPVSGSATFTVTDGPEPAASPTPTVAPVEVGQGSADDRSMGFSALAMAGGAALVALATGLLFWLMRR